MTRRQILRSWPWTAALAVVVCGFIVLGMLSLSTRASGFGALLSLALIGFALVALYRVLTSGVHVLPTGLLIRELTRTTPVPWVRIRSITTAPTGRKGVYAPVLTVVLESGGKRRPEETLEVTVLASYREEVARRRTAELVAARAAATRAAR